MQNNNEDTINYLMQMSVELKKIAESISAPSLALLFDMVSCEAKDQLSNS